MGNRERERERESIGIGAHKRAAAEKLFERLS